MTRRSLRTAVAAALAVGFSGVAVPATAGAQTVAAPAACTVSWRVAEKYHGFTAGYSWAWTDIVRTGASGDEVREIQCLAKYWGSDPGQVDGIFGQLTQAAVKQQQRTCNIAQDGEVGPNTWRCIRGGGPDGTG
ncbi:peptidoglycan-binding domain-containing protein [Streptomyces olivoreticuli]|uniref:peptidoglycan-binding domain-containing protein n=1 Tax=Streptomyces olivoreticuli TaxID=68246 RepID=UPI001F07E95B|nr:peptidoglycan-binding domain-containing protein [Streptomyces olivoreticuli]